ncbi:MAG TPA: FecR domain-containing protein [Steroidobacteraceae bacterium]|jgi:transmembrane sensor|nr:FecR domain-containing protein [Steroidobacteraceae bacterium]
MKPPTREAARWHTRLGGGLTTAERREFQEWIADPANAREFEACRYLVDVAMELKGRQRLEVLASVAHAKAARSWGAALREGLGFGSVWIRGAAAAAIVLAVVTVWSALRIQGYVAQVYQTATGQERDVVLPDGSVVGLNTQTELEWVGSPSDRRVRLIRGEAYFQVVHDPSRPFRIVLAHSEVQVLGTRFDVYQMANGDVRVSVVSGMVAVEALENGAGATPSWSRHLSAGQQIEYSPVGLVADVHTVFAPKVVRWRQGILETPGEPLSDFISDLSRYTTERIVIADPRAAVQKVGGAFSIHDIDASLDRLSRVAPITVTHENGEVVLGYRPAADSARARRAVAR